MSEGVLQKWGIGGLELRGWEWVFGIIVLCEGGGRSWLVLRF